MSNAEVNSVMNEVLKNRERILILEKIVEKLVNEGSVNQYDYRKFSQEAFEEVKKDFALN